MKNSALTLAIVLFTAFVTTAFAQESTTIDVSSSPIAKGQLFLGATSNGGLNFSTSYTDFNGENDGKNKSTSFSLNPTAGYFIIDNLAVGGQVSFATSKFKSGGEFNFESKQTTITAGPFVRYYFDTGIVKPYVSSSILFGSTKSKSESFIQANSDFGGINTDEDRRTITVWGIHGGVSIFLNSSIAIDLDLGYSISASKDEDPALGTKFKTENFGLNFGFSLFL